MNEMKLSDFNYELPQELIAQDPLLKRSDSRLMVLNRATGGIEHRHFSDVIEYLIRVIVWLSMIQRSFQPD